MKLLLKVIFILATLFGTTFLIIKLTGLLEVEEIEGWFLNISAQPDYLIGGLVILLLFADLFIAVPTMTVIILAGYFLGFQTAFLYAFIGLASAAFSGYLLSLVYGEKLLQHLSRDQVQKLEMQRLFRQHGVLMLTLCRAMPMLPEITACLAGTCKMSVGRFLLGWSLGTLPYLLVVAYAGSVSDLENPLPAVFTAIGVTGLLWVSWLWLIRRRMATRPARWR